MLDQSLESNFERLYNNLNKAQKQAVDTIDGPVMVIAGPGTGKTTILTLRIANIIQKTDTAPENILALTFTESGAYAMRKKLVSIIGSAGYKVSINTFHSFCNDIIKQYPEKFPRIIGSTAITDIDQIAVMEKIIDGNDFEMLKPYGDTFFYVRPALSEIRNLKREALGPLDFEKIIKKREKEFKDIPDKVHEKGAHKGKMKGEFIKLQEKNKKNKELLRLYEAYEKSLEIEKFYDFEDMIVEVVKTLEKDEDLLLIIQESYQYILADEHQDANNAQNAVLKLLSNFHENPNLFIVGDEKQAIFRFQGASLENFLYFKKLYKDAVVINLEENYRSTQPILDASHSLLSSGVELQSKSQTGKELVSIYECLNFDSEYAFIIKNIQEKLKEGIESDEIAILYRDNKDAFAIGHALSKTNIPYRIESDNDILKDEDVSKLILIFSIINNLTNDEILGKALFIDFFNLNIIDIYKTFEQSRKERKNLIDIVSERFPDISQKLSRWSRFSHNTSFTKLFEVIVRESGYLDYVLSAHDSLEKMAVLEAFFLEIKKMTSGKKEYFLVDFLRHIERVKEHGILTKSGKSLEKKGVRLMTAHKSKGLEFDIVYIIGAYDGHWGNKKRRTYFNTLQTGDTSIDDERRLFYVALTRARKQAIITYPKENIEGKELSPTQFISEIAAQFKKEEIVSEIAKIEDFLNESVIHENHEIINKEYLQNLLLERGLSVTALNNYLTCPWNYFFKNLIRLPENQTKHQMYGTAVHQTLKTFFDKYKAQEDVDLQGLLMLFEFNLNRIMISSADLEDTLHKGKKALEGYFEAYKGTWNRNLLTEYSIRGVHLNIGNFDLILKGDLDKIEFINDRDVNVVDYKTGKKKSLNKENYERQLTFYKLLLDLDDKKKFSMKSGELDFIEPNESGKYKKEKFDVRDEDVEKLKELIKEKAQEIYTLFFWNKNCNEKDCEYCALGNTLSKRSRINM